MKLSPAALPDGPVVDPILEIHRGPDGRVPFARKIDDWEELGAVPVQQLRDAFPEFREELERDAYFGLNTIGDHATMRVCGGLLADHDPANPKLYGPWKVATIEGQTVEIRKEKGTRHLSAIGFPSALRDQQQLRWINALFVDIDCHGSDADLWSVFAEIGRMQDCAVIPPASLLARSGRGWWLFWFIVDERNPAAGEVTINGARHTPATPQRAWPDQIAHAAAINRALQARLAAIGADPQAVDPARLARVPGSINSAAPAPHQRVMYWVQANANRERYYYTLDALARFVGIPSRSMLRATRTREQQLAESRVPARRNGHQAVCRYWLADFERLIALRGGGFAQGLRNQGALFLALGLSKNHVSEHETAQKVRAYGRGCRPPLTQAECNGVVRSVARQPNKRAPLPSRPTIIETFHVTATELVQLTWLRESANPYTPKTRRGPARRRERLEAIRAIVAEGSRVLSSREMAARLRTMGFETTHVTVLHDYERLGLSSSRRRQDLAANLELPLAS